MNHLTIRASAAKPSLDAIRKRVEERRQPLEAARTMKIQRIQQDIERIAKREREYTEKLLSEIVPVKIVFNQGAWDRLKEFIPFTVEPTPAAAAAAASAETPSKTEEPTVDVIPSAEA